MIKALSIQVQPHRAPGLDMTAIQAAFQALTQLPLVVRHQFSNGRDNVEYFNFTLGTEDLSSLWREVQSRLYEEAPLGPWMAAASMAMCEGPSGWDDYLLLYHFDPAVKRDALSPNGT
jgi:hypothetical protein